MSQDFEIVTVDADNVNQRGFFCYMSKPKSPGYLQKRAWLDARFAEGMKIKIIHEIGGRDTAFIEYIPGEYAWRAVYSPGYLVIHCLWVVGKGKHKGYGSRLVQECLEDARQLGKHGVVMVASDGVWLASKKLFLHQGFVEVGQAPPSFQLLVHRFENGPQPFFPTDWATRQGHFGPGLTVVRTPQCPYIENASADFLKSAQALNIPARQVELRSAKEVQELSPSPYGVFGVVLNGKLLAYHYLDQKELEKRLRESQ